MNKFKIEILSTIFSDLKKELDISRQTVYNALRYITNSETAKNIGKRAKELLQDKVNKVVIDTNDIE